MVNLYSLHLTKRFILVTITFAMKNDNLKAEYQKVLNQLQRAKYELFIFYEISNFMRATLKLEHILYIILTSVTAKEGLGFDRAFLFLVNEDSKALVGKMAIGPRSGEEPDKIWKQIKLERKDLSALVESYKELSKKISQDLTNLVKKVTIPLEEDEGIPALTALEQMPHKVVISESHHKVNNQILELLQPHDFVAVPLQAKDKTLGVIMADNIVTRKPITQDDVKILTLFANQAGLAIENSKFYEHTKRKAETDSLTGLYNHGRFQKKLSDEFQRAKRYKANLSLLFLDIDYFKSYNDSFGHVAGDDLLRRLSGILLKNARKLDIVARYGGEEFAIILPQTKKEQALKLAQRIRKAVEKYNFENQEQLPNGKVTVSIGVVSYSNQIQSKEDLIKKVDLALYKAKSEGRNKVVLLD